VIARDTWVVRWVSLGVLAAAGVLLAVFWGDVPDRWITHWGPHGADGWATKTAANAALPLILGLAMWLLFEAIAVFTARSGRRAGFPREVMAVLATVERSIGLALSLLFGALALALPLLQPRSSLPIAVGFPLVIGLVVGGAIVWAWREIRRLRAAGVAFPEGYAGFVYKNPRDARLWVPKVVGPGWTINFAHRLAWPVMVAIVAGTLLIVVVVSRVAR
jgi:Family of unknown function (DUF5808)